jgi:hypothetical protein
MPSMAKIAKRPGSNGSSTVTRCSTIARAIIAPENTIPGAAVAASLSRATRDPTARRTKQIAVSANAAEATNQRSTISTRCENDGSERARKLLTVQFAQQPRSKYGSRNSASKSAASSVSR